MGIISGDWETRSTWLNINTMLFIPLGGRSHALERDTTWIKRENLKDYDLIQKMLCSVMIRMYPTLLQSTDWSYVKKRICNPACIPIYKPFYSLGVQQTLLIHSDLQ